MSIVAKAAELVETLGGEHLCRLMGHHWGVTAPLKRTGYPAVKLCSGCGTVEALPSAPPTDHPETMTYDPYSPDSVWLRTIEPEVFTEGAS